MDSSPAFSLATNEYARGGALLVECIWIVALCGSLRLEKRGEGKRKGKIPSANTANPETTTLTTAWTLSEDRLKIIYLTEANHFLHPFPH